MPAELSMSAELSLEWTLHCQSCGSELILNQQASSTHLALGLLLKAEEDFGWRLGPPEDRLSVVLCHECADHGGTEGPS